MSEHGDIENFLLRLHELDEEVTYDAAIDLVFNTMDDAMFAGHDAQQWPWINEVVQRVTADGAEPFSVQILIAFLSILKPVKSSLIHYERLYELMIEQAVREGRTSENGLKLVRGFEPADQKNSAT